MQINDYIRLDYIDNHNFTGPHNFMWEARRTVFFSTCAANDWVQLKRVVQSTISHASGKEGNISGTEKVYLMNKCCDLFVES